jgi:hypothetical protein
VNVVRLVSGAAPHDVHCRAPAKSQQIAARYAVRFIDGTVIAIHGIVKVAAHCDASPKESLMNRHVLLGSLGLLLASACNQSPAKEQEAARSAQQSADEKSNQFRATAEEKSAEEQAKANDKAREAARTLDETKNDYRHKAQSDLDALTKKIDDLKAKSSKATGQTKVDLDRALADVTARRDAVDGQIRSIDAANADQIETVKARLDDQIAQLRQSVNEAEKRI